MSSWHGANTETTNDTPHPNQPRRPRRHDPSSSLSSPPRHGGTYSDEETVEAVLNRLIKSYTTAMECINTFRKLETLLYEQQQPQQPSPSSVSFIHTNHYETPTTATEDTTATTSLTLLCRVGRVARHTLERAIFQNPVVVSTTSGHSPMMMTTTMPLSPSHWSTVRHIAYLSYINYADLLLMGVISSSSLSSSPRHTTTLLDRGVVPSLRVVNNHASNATSCWVLDQSTNPTDADLATTFPESEEATVRLAMTAYMEALSMEASDPTVYIKLASAARRLNRLLLSSSSSSSSVPSNHNGTGRRRNSSSKSIKNGPYRKLERYALECAMTTTLSLHHDVPVNRTAQRALQEWWSEEEQEDEWLSHENDDDEDDDDEIPDATTTLFPMEPPPMTIVLPRYSWVTFGRMLLRACKDGTVYQSRAVLSSPVSSFMSPRIRLQLSPLVALPTILLSNVVSFLSSKQLWPLEATCRALSASMVSVRVLLNNQSTKMITDRDISVPMISSGPEDLEVPNPEVTLGGEVPPMLSTAEDELPLNEAAPDETVEPIKRKSSRVQSQMITSSKRTERQNRRNSIEFCFLASILGCSTIDDPVYQRLVQSYNHYIQEQTGNDSGFDSHDTRRGSISGTDGKEIPNVVTTTAKSQQSFYWNEASLYRFVHDSISNRQYQSPLACMFRFVAHASMYASQVFATTPDTTSVLDMQAHMLDCIEWMNQRTQLGTELISCWSLFRNHVPNDADMDHFQLFAIDLLHAELRLRRCEVEELENCDFDSDCNFTSIVVPPLLDFVSKMDQKSIAFERKQIHDWKMLKTRFYWMVANWYFWRGRKASNLGESRQAEEEGLAWVEETKKCLADSEPIITPHLSSALRKGQHWKELSLSTLSFFTDEVQASAVVLLAQERFLDVTAIFSAEENNLQIEQSHCDALASIGDILMERYSFTSDKSKSVEIIENFLCVHGEKLSAMIGSDDDTRRGWFADLIPSMKIESHGIYKFPISPAILTIFVTCLRTNVEHSITIAVLLSRLVLVLVDLSDSILARQNIQWEKKMNAYSTNDLLSDCDSDIDDDFLSLDEFGEVQSSRQKLSSDDVKLQRYSSLARLLLERILSFCKEAMSMKDQLMFMQSNEFISIINRSLAYTADLFRSSQPMLLETNDFGILVSVQELFHFAQSVSLGDTLGYNSLSRGYIAGMFHIVIVQRQVLTSLSQFKPNKTGRTERLRATRKRADLVAKVCFDVGCFLSSNLSSLEASGIVCADIVADLISTQQVRLVTICDALLWFWKAANDVNVSDPHLSSYLDGFGRERLRVPLATLLIGLCGSTVSENPVLSALSSELVSLPEFYDSDASAVELMNDSDEDDDPDTNEKFPELLRIIQAVYCVCNVFGSLDEKEVCSCSYIENYSTSYGPGLPLVVARVLNVFANRLLLGFNHDDVDSRGIWGDYSIGTRGVGSLLDSTLWKAYKCLHGFVLTNETKDANGGTIGSNGTIAEYFPPENERAAAMLYRCIMRTYALGRRSPPKAAFETVLAALPHLEESKKSSSIRKYLFAPNKNDDEGSSLLSLALQRPGWTDSFSKVEGFGWIHANDHETSDDETSLVRRGLARLMAHGPIPRLQDNGDEKDWRNTSMQSEEDLHTKFNAVVDDLCFGDATDWEGWFKASQCLNLKSDLIADRLGMSRGFSHIPKFSFQERRSMAPYSYNLADLKAKQNREQRQHDDGWIQSIGRDLSIFVRYNWSSFNSLKRCYNELAAYFDRDDNLGAENAENQPRRRSWLEIKAFYEAKDFGLWQQALGGLFVSSLRRVAYRCLSMALYMSNKRDIVDHNVHSELAETLGVNLYMEMMGSQSYGYPMKLLTVSRRRDLASDSLECFERAMACMQLDESSGDTLEAWSLLFMKGKCQEKIARSFENEAFASNIDASYRQYEHHMSIALNAYSESAAYASRLKEKGSFISEQNGGSSHGVLEAFYRLHASRLKCLIAAVAKSDDEREFAEQEALRLTERHWFQNLEVTNENSSLRQRLWDVLEDVVGALAKCSLDNSHFHRSVYRHSQALMWAPIIYNPTEQRAKGSLGTVPATWACKIRGLNSSTNAASSGLNIITSLFAKKRSQLVAVWVTMDSETTPFEIINRSARKYDSLRGKYVAAYIESLCLCRRRKELDLFLSWTTSCPRDLPSHFAASSLLEGAMPTKASTLDSLVSLDGSVASFHFLKTVRRLTNSALAKVMLEDMREYLLKKNFKPSDSGKFFETQLKIAYACFLRVNCEFEDVSKRRSWLYEKQSGLMDIVEALTVAYTNAYDETATASRVDPCDWSGESHLIKVAAAALQKCKELYPSLSRNFSFTRQRAATKPKSPSFGATSKRKLSLNHEKKSFEVSIPKGLKKGDTFLTSIAIGDKTKRVRLTVPAESASSLRFSLQIPMKDTDTTPVTDANSGST